MKKLISLLTLIITLFLSFSISFASTLEGNITWQYNDFIGTKPDVGANIYLYSYGMNPADSFGNASNEEDFLIVPKKLCGVYHVRADGYGHYAINNLPAGKYLVFVVSSKTVRDLTDNNDCDLRWQVMNRYSLLSKDTFMNLSGAAMNKSTFSTITIPENGAEIFSYDFGYTWI